MADMPPTISMRGTKTDRRRIYDRERRTNSAARAWYNSKAWRSKRLHQLRDQPLCEYCAADGITTEATIANHDPPHRGDETAFFFGPLKSACKACHDGRIQAEERKRDEGS